MRCVCARSKRPPSGLAKRTLVDLPQPSPLFTPRPSVGSGWLSATSQHSSSTLTRSARTHPPDLPYSSSTLPPHQRSAFFSCLSFLEIPATSSTLLGLPCTCTISLPIYPQSLYQYPPQRSNRTRIGSQVPLPTGLAIRLVFPAGMMRFQRSVQNICDEVEIANAARRRWRTIADRSRLGTTNSTPTLSRRRNATRTDGVRVCWGMGMCGEPCRGGSPPTLCRPCRQLGSSGDRQQEICSSR